MRTQSALNSLHSKLSARNICKEFHYGIHKNYVSFQVKVTHSNFQSKWREILILTFAQEISSYFLFPFFVAFLSSAKFLKYWIQLPCTLNMTVTVFINIYKSTQPPFKLRFLKTKKQHNNLIDQQILTRGYCSEFYFKSLTKIKHPCFV